MTVTERKSNM